MLKALLDVGSDEKPRKKKPSKALAGKWVITAPLEEVEMDLQSMIDAVPKKGGKLFISGGVYNLTEPLRLPDDPDTKVIITGCTFNGDAKEAGTVIPGRVSIEGMGAKVYWGGGKWKASIDDATPFDTKEAADKAAFEVVTRNPKLTGSVETVKV